MAKKAATSSAPGVECRVLLLQGSEHFIAVEHTNALRGRLQAELGQVDVISFDGTTARLADVLDECRSFGLMQQHKMVVVDNADQLVKADNRPLIERYTEHPADQATLVLRAGKWNKGKLDDLIKAVGAIVACEAPGPEKAAAWCVARCAKRHRATITHDAAMLLVERVGADLGRLDSELGKLAGIAAAAEVEQGLPGETPTITPQLVGGFVGMSREEEVWGVQSTLLTDGPQAAIGHVRDLIDVSRQPTTMITYAMIDLARKLHAASRAGKAGANPFELAKALKLWGPSKDPLLAAARAIPPATALRLFDECIKTDVRQKTGLTEADRACEIGAWRFANASATTRGRR